MTKLVQVMVPVAANSGVVSSTMVDLDAPLTEAGQVYGAATPYVTVSERGDPSGGFHRSVFTFSGLPVTMRDTQQGGGVQFYTFPSGKISRLGASGTVLITTHSALASTLHAGVTCQWGVGSTTQANATLATTEQDFVQVAAFTSSATIDVAPAAANGYGVGTFTLLDGSSTAIKLFLNVAVANAADIDAVASLLVSGTVAVSWLRV